MWYENETIVLHTTITSVGCNISFLILYTVPRTVAKATRPFPFRVWSGFETTSAITNSKNSSRNVGLEELAEKWPKILRNCSVLRDTCNALIKNASNIYLGLVTTHCVKQP